MLPSDLEIVVLSHPAKAATTVEMLGVNQVPFRLFENTEHEFPSDHPELQVDRSWRPDVRGYALRQWRAFRGHQEICRTAEKPYTLVFEDDAWLKPGVDIFKVIELAYYLVRPACSPYAVSLHGRNCELSQVGTLVDYGVVAPKEIIDPGQLYFLQFLKQTWPDLGWPPRICWCEGSTLAYLLGPEAKAAWARAKPDRYMPCDLFLVNAFQTFVATESPFLHDQRHGSLISNTGNAARRLSPDGTRVLPDPPLPSDILSGDVCL